MSNTPLVSILMTAYNREKYIAEAIESVLASTYSNWELIIVDDQSKDKTVSIAKEYANKDNRIRIYINETNLGDYGNRNKAASYANGKYLKYVDADDYIYPYGLEQLVYYMEQFPTAGWGLCSLQQTKIQPYPLLLTPSQAFAYNYFTKSIFHKAPLSAIIKKNVFDLVEGFDEIRMAGDFNMWNKLAKKNNVLLMPEGIVWYREHDNQEMNDYHRYILTYTKIKKNHMMDPSTPLDVKQRKRILKNINREELNFRIISLLKGKFKLLSDANNKAKSIKLNIFNQ